MAEGCLDWVKLMNTSIKLNESRILVTGMILNIDKILDNEVLSEYFSVSRDESIYKIYL